MNLPKSDNLPVPHLAACFNDTSATYKYYWLLSILQEIENGNEKILKRNLFSRMISNAWYTVNYFHISYGQQDLIQKAIQKILELEKIPIDEKQEIVFEKLSTVKIDKIKSILWHFNKNVPHWFLTPWFPKIKGETYSSRKKRIYNESKVHSFNCLYALENEFIFINPNWINYLRTNTRILKDFCYWNLSLFLQAKNPNVPDIPNKLIKPAIRNDLTKQREYFWNMVFKELGCIQCIYTGKNLTKENYAVEHFIPYNFVSHDLMWNLIPADKEFNSSKNDKLPPLEKYFKPFFSIQKQAVGIIREKAPTSKFLLDYLTILPDTDKNFTETKFMEQIQPLITIAANNGFEFMS